MGKNRKSVIIFRVGGEVKVIVVWGKNDSRSQDVHSGKAGVRRD